jgi:hypothetical protein
LTPKQLLRPSEIWYRKCTEIHLRAYRIPKIFPRTPVKKRRGRKLGKKGSGIGREGEREGRKGR